MEIKIMPVGLIGTNCYVISKGELALIVDPGGDADQIINYIKGTDLNVQAILLTHAHYDHIGGLEDLRGKLNVDTYIHELEQSWLGDPLLNGSHKLIGHEITASVAENNLKEGEMRVGGFTFTVLHTPGHSPGSVSFLFEETKQAFSGDVLFNQGIGRTDLLGGDLQTIEHSIKEKLYKLDDAYRIYPGHGPSTTIGFEKRNNPFFRE